MAMQISVSDVNPAEQRFCVWAQHLRAFVNGGPTVRSFWLTWRGERLKAVSHRGGPLELYRAADGLEEFVGYASEVVK